MWLWLFFLSITSYSQTIEKFCFNSPARKSAVIKSLSPLLLPADTLTQEDSCFTLMVAPNRRELLQKYILGQDPEARISFSSEEKRKDLCRLKVEKIKHQTGKGVDVSLRGAKASETNSQGRDISRIQSVGEFSLSLDQNVIEGNCRYITPERYEIKLEVRKDPRPLHPPASSGVVIIINGAPPPADETSKLQTTIQLTRGERIHLGSMKQNKKEEKKRAELSPQIGFEDSSSNRSEEIYLSID